MSLQSYLQTLNSSETQWNIYVHIEDTDNYKCSQWDEEYPWVSIGTPEALSFGYQSMSDAISALLESGEFAWNGQSFRLDAKEIVDTWEDGTLADEYGEEFAAALEAEATDLTKIWAKDEAEFFIEVKLPEILAAAKESHEESLVEA